MKKLLCGKCGSDLLQLVESKTTDVTILQTIPCTCSDSDSEVAYQETTVYTDEEVETCWLMEDGTVEFYDQDTINHNKEVLDGEVFCAVCSQTNETLSEVVEVSRKELPDMATQFRG